MMRLRAALLLALCLGDGGSRTGWGAEADAGHAADGPAAPRLGTGLPGQIVYVRACATCHDNPRAASGATGRAPPALRVLQQYSPERVMSALATGKMKGMAVNLPSSSRQAVAEWLGGRPLGAGRSADARHMSGRCGSGSWPSSVGDAPDWNGWGADERNTRFTQAEALTAVNVPSLQLLWAFGFPGGVEAYSQPSVVAGRVYVGSDNGFVYALDAATGCVHWSFAARAGVRTAPSVVAVPGDRALPEWVIFGDMKGFLYAVDARSGRLRWSLRVDDQPTGKITAAPTVVGDRVYVGTTTGEEVTATAPGYPCCRTRGSVVAVDARRGALLWKTYMVAEAAHRLAARSAGTNRWGPAGVGVWSSPTIDRERGLLYVGTGDAYTEPAAPLADSIVALDLATGKVAWSYQDTPDDAWLAGCAPDKPEGNCPRRLGPDWDFGDSPMLRTVDGQSLLIDGHKGGVVIAVQPAAGGRVRWRTNLPLKPPGAGGEIVFGGAADADAAYFGLNSGDVVALGLRDGGVRWRTSVPAARADHPGFSAAVTVIPGVLFAGGWDGVLRALSTVDGRLLWSYDTAREFHTANGVAGHGGSMGAPGPTIAGGRLFITSGYVGVGNGMPGNVLLAFGLR